MHALRPQIAASTLFALNALLFGPPAAPASAAQSGLYVADGSAPSVLGYATARNTKNKPPKCGVVSGGPVNYITDIGVDPHGNLMMPGGNPRSVAVFAGPKMCGPKVGSFTVTGGQPIAAVSRDAVHGKIYALVIGISSGYPGAFIAVCTLAAGCTAMLSNIAISSWPRGIAQDAHGNVYMSGVVSGSGGAALVYYKNGAGSGKVLTSYANSSAGSLDIAPDGSLVAMDPIYRGVGAVYVYTECPTLCVPHGPSLLRALSGAGKVTGDGRSYVTADFANNAVDIYDYLGITGVNYKKSFSNGLDPKYGVSGVAPVPATP